MIDEVIIDQIIKFFELGRVVPFLGAGVNLCDRPGGESWVPGRDLPSGQELAKYLAQRIDYPIANSQDLLRVSQYVAVTAGDHYLRGVLRDVFDVDYPVTRLHRSLARLPATLRKLRGLAPQQLIVTTNYDDVLERAFLEESEPYDLVTYTASENGAGKFLHTPPGGEPIMIEVPNEYTGLVHHRHPIILKLSGAVDRHHAYRDSYVITEDDYIDYLTTTLDITQSLPIPLPEKLSRSHLLFLGYSLSNWSPRVILRRIWKDRLKYASWCVGVGMQDFEVHLWNKSNIQVIDAPLGDFVTALTEQLEGRRFLAGDRIGRQPTGGEL